MPPAAVAVTVTDLFAASTLLSLPRTVTVPALVVAPAAMVSVVPDCVKSPATAPVEATADDDTVSVTGWLDGPDSAAVTVETPPFSETADGPRARLAVGRVSSSVRVSAAPVTAPVPWPLTKVAVTVTLRPALPWWTSSFTAVTVAVSEAAVVDPAAIVMVASEPTV